MASLLSQKPIDSPARKQIELVLPSVAGWVGTPSSGLKKEDRGAQRGLLRRRKAFNV
jgi:hypothetical protein